MENNVNGLFHQQENNMFDMRKTARAFRSCAVLLPLPRPSRPKSRHLFCLRIS